jgi:hypothetical protein
VRAIETAVAVLRDERESPIPEVLLVEVAVDPVQHAVTLTYVEGRQFCILGGVTGQNVDACPFELRP